MELIKHAASVLIGFGSGAVISGAVFAFVTMVGAVTRLAQKTGTQRFVRVYESAIAAGGILGCVANLFSPRINLGQVVSGAAVVVIALANGVFFGVMAMSLAEVLNVIPILSRRGKLRRALFFFVLAIALGKAFGSILYFLKPGFFDGSQL